MPQARAVATRGRILEAAATLFAEHGYETTSTADIVALAGTTKGALYFHFATKAAIAAVVMEYQTEALTIPESPSPLQSVIDITTGYAYRLQTDVMLRGAVRLSVDSASTATPNVGAFIEPIDALEALLVRAREQGEILDSVRPRELAEFVTGCFTGVQLLSQVLSKRADLDHRVTVMWQSILPGIASPQAQQNLRLARATT